MMEVEGRRPIEESRVVGEWALRLGGGVYDVHAMTVEAKAGQ